MYKQLQYPFVIFISEILTECIKPLNYSRKMNRNEIGVNAGKVWQLLSNNEKWSYGLLKRKSGLKDKELGAALGWLSRENKIEFDQCDEELYVYLCVNVYIG